MKIEKPKFASTATLERFAGYRMRTDWDYFLIKLWRITLCGFACVREKEILDCLLAQNKNRK
ncbi:MAG: hypothetical protein A2315_16060 [Ignavibacteria bacterium RIFOXYB2_FULL_35_12]|nr:MAG: hypothetical protein A2455_16500 [Ignavibacteria bacterium RIFOXYC2_FULL_35_16]OGV03454.1 MAG: hypothetical protein A2315_16060 [Ignavibacteria bacterium RIFOXYB2_FULL_35_12]OGV21064.1 MAG: hypothetical protein A3J84_02190 [Ignavibacteria bacterium RIFOXYA2_FULL_37_17]